MKHEDFLKKYMDIQKQEVKALNDALAQFPNGEYSWTEDGAASPYVNYDDDGVERARVIGVKAPVCGDSGITISTEYGDQPFEVGYKDIVFGDIDGILDNLPSVEG